MQVAQAQEAPASSPADVNARLQSQQQEIDRQRKLLQQQQQQLDALTAAVEAQSSRPFTPGTSPSSGAAPQGLADRAANGPGLHFAGYADMSYTRYDFYQNTQTTKPVTQATSDVTRFVLAPHMDFGRGWSFFGEIEIEHGGTGTSVEYEADESGEFETEVEQGGEVALEQAWLQYSHSAALNFRVGEIVVPVGMINSYHQPTEYFTVERSLGETSLIPSVWHQSGIQALGQIGQLRYQLQMVTALDSTGFSGYDFVVGGMQNRFEGRYSNAFAYVAQAEYALAPGVLIGAAYYTGDSEPNRPRRNLEKPAQVTLYEVHGRYETGPATVRGQYLKGEVQNADAVTQANLNTFNGSELGTSRTAVGKQAHSWFVEAGYDLLSFFFNQPDWGRFDVFARYDDYDTNEQAAPGHARVLRYDRTAVTYGFNYKPQPGIVFKAEYSRRENAADIANTQDFWGFAAGFEF
jgi:hypothetical protein